MARILAWPDTHVPFDHPKAPAFLEKIYNKYKCDRVVQLGDLADFAGFSTKWKPDPNGYSPGQEYQLLREGLEIYYKKFPFVDVVAGNHDLRPHRAMFESGLPHQLAKSLGEFFGSPKGWTWHYGSLVIDGVRYHHGNRLSASKLLTAHQKSYGSSVSGHLHNVAAAIYHYSDTKKRFFTLSAGCLIDSKAYAFRYNDENYNQAVLGCGVIIDGETAIFEPFPLKWL